MKDASGKEITTREFFSRWKEGMNSVTPMQQTNISIGGNILILIGVIIGLFSTWNTKWLFIILLGSLFLVGVQMIGIFQRWIVLREMKKILETNAILEIVEKEVQENV